MMRYGLGGMHMLGGWIVSAVLGLIFVALAVLAIIALIRIIRHTDRRNAATPMAKPAEGVEALRILDERFAKGEIGEEEYTRKKELLRKP